MVKVDIGRIVKVIESQTVPNKFLGDIGIVTGKAYGNKWSVMFYMPVGELGSLSHTVDEDELVVIGTAFNY